MLKRIRYISEFSRHMSPQDIDKLAQQSAISNKEHGITGILVATGELFFQVIEGPVDAIDALYDKLSADSRHRQFLLLEAETGDLTRLFPDWAMRRLDLSDEAMKRLSAARAILKAIHAQRIVLQNLRGALEQTMWQEVVSSGALKKPLD
jgi:hypothetical protein